MVLSLYSFPLIFGDADGLFLMGRRRILSISGLSEGLSVTLLMGRFLLNIRFSSLVKIIDSISTSVLLGAIEIINGIVII